MALSFAELTALGQKWLDDLADNCDKIVQDLGWSDEPIFSRASGSWTAGEVYKAEEDSLKDGPQSPTLKARPFNASGIELYVATYNLNGQGANLITEDLLLGCPSSSDAPVRPDVYAINLQECVNPSACCRKLQDLLGPDYRLVRCEAMLQVSLMVFASLRIQFLTHSVFRGQLATGIGTILGNKGAVAVGLSIAGMSLLLVGSHLLPHENQVAARNKQLAYIQQNLRLYPHKAWTMAPGYGVGQPYPTPSPITPGVDTGGMQRQGSGGSPPRSPTRARATSLSAPTTPEEPASPTSISQQFEFTIWMGDLNYRVVGDREELAGWLAEEATSKLLDSDQLTQEMRDKNVFAGFQEGGITFPPTYKFDVGTDTYDSSAKQRTPSWTDRVLFKIQPTAEPGSLQQTEYHSIPGMRESDHRPVYSRFLLDITARLASLQPSDTDAISAVDAQKLDPALASEQPEDNDVGDTKAEEKVQAEGKQDPGGTVDEEQVGKVEVAAVNGAGAPEVPVSPFSGGGKASQSVPPVPSSSTEESTNRKEVQQ